MSEIVVALFTVAVDYGLLTQAVCIGDQKKALSIQPKSI